MAVFVHTFVVMVCSSKDNAFRNVNDGVLIGVNDSELICSNTNPSEYHADLDLLRHFHVIENQIGWTTSPLSVVCVPPGHVFLASQKDPRSQLNDEVRA